MVRRAIVALIVLLIPALAEARGGRGFSIGLRGSTKSASHAIRPAPPRAGVGVGVGVGIPLSRRSSEPSPQRAAGGGAAPARVVSPAAATAAAVEPVPPRPWCEGGQIVGGFCALN
jgi:hypothetical protein